MSSVSPVRAPINPAVLTWAIDSAGFDREDVARSAGVDARKLASWEQGSERPTLNQLRDLANKVKRPYPIFFLKAPPSGNESLPDLRTRGSLTGEYSPPLRLEIRRAKYYQTLVADHKPPLLEPVQAPSARIEDSPRDVAAGIRAWLGVDLETQRQFRSDDRGFAQWRGIFLERGVLSYVFRLEALEEGETSEALGFCLPAEIAPMVAVNGDGAPAEKVFGLFHELGHLVLGAPGVSASPSPNAAFPSPTEQWCNRFANRCLLPDDPGLEEIVAQLPTDAKAFDAYQKAATKLRVSRYVLLTRARDEGWIPATVFDSLRTVFVTADEERREEDRRKKIEKRERDKAAGKKGGAQSPVELSLSRRGAAAAAKIAQRWSEGRLSDDEAAELLDIDPSQLDAILQ
ncbi:MAG: ImmA/IrrE family metallo-endopeptidase, partial [Alphaproteobacteria bacterium]